MIDDIKDLRSLYAEPGIRAQRKQLSALDSHCRKFISLSPFLVMATAGANGMPDASPRGGEPGFVHVASDTELHIPDARGNNRLDSMANIIESGSTGLLFMIPGVDETLRINGEAILRDDAAALASFKDLRHQPKVVIEVTVVEAFLHCAKALMRSRLWYADARVQRSILPTMGQMLSDQIGDAAPVESQETMVKRYQKDL